MTTGILNLTVQVAAATAIGNTACQEPMLVNLSHKAKPDTEAVMVPNPSDTQGSLSYRPVNPVQVQVSKPALPMPWWSAQDLSAFEALTDEMPGLEGVLLRAREPLEAAFGGPLTATVSVRNGDRGAVVMIAYTSDRATALRNLRQFEQTWLFNQEDNELDRLLFYLANE